nr:MAG TPA: hypothetical protein [Caudoviricetes sp.]
METKPTRSSRRADSATDRPTCSQHLHTSRQRLCTYRKQQTICSNPPLGWLRRQKP